MMNPKSLANLRPNINGETRNPGGKPKGLRDTISKTFLKALKEDFDEHGVQAIAEMREKDTSSYIKVVASLIPKEMNLNIRESVFEQLSDDELIALLDAIRRAGNSGDIIEAECEEITTEFH